MRILLFEDRLTENLTPIITSRPAYAISCGSYRLIDLIRELQLPVFADVRPHLQPIQDADFEEIQPNLTFFDSQDHVIVLNARMVPSLENLSTLKQLVASGQPGVAVTGDSIAAAILPPDHTAFRSATTDLGQIVNVLGETEDLKTFDVSLPLFDWPLSDQGSELKYGRLKRYL